MGRALPQTHPLHRAALPTTSMELVFTSLVIPLSLLGQEEQQPAGHFCTTIHMVIINFLVPK